MNTLLIQRLLFAFLCATWGLNWIAMKVGVSAVPPAFFSGVRWSFAGAVLLLWRLARGESNSVPPRLWFRVFWLSLVLIFFNAWIMLYGLRHVTSGLASVLSSALTPIGLLWFAVLFGQERMNRRQLAAIGVGIAGLLLLYWPKLAAGRFDLMEGLGALGIIVGNLIYCFGSVVARPMMRTLPPAVFAAWTNFIGGLTLLFVALAVEPGVTPDIMSGRWGLGPWIAWLFMVFAGSLGATVIYFVLVRDWGASRTGTYAFIVPIISVVAGVFMLGETVELLEAAGMALMLAAAFMVLRAKTEPVS